MNSRIDWDAELVAQQESCAIQREIESYPGEFYHRCSINFPPCPICQQLQDDEDFFEYFNS